MTVEETARRFVDFAVHLKRFFRTEMNLQEGCLTDERFRSLHYLEGSEGVALSELSERIRISPSSLCLMLKKMEEEGLVERNRGSKDRRKVLYSISRLGLKRLDDDRSRRLAALTERFKALSQADRDRLHQAMDSMESILR
jgi:DNA-binding MarR family transcriptional regulator